MTSTDREACARTSSDGKDSASQIHSPPLLLVGVLLSVVASSALNAVPADSTPIHHRIQVMVQPGEGRLVATDVITGDDLGDRVRFTLNDSLIVSPGEGGWRIVEEEVDRDGPSGGIDHRDATDPRVGRRSYLATRSAQGTAPLRVRYSGTITHPVTREGEEYARSFSSTPGIVCDEGVYLGGAAAWIPEFGDRLFTYELMVRLPSGWEAVSQGTRTARESGEGWSGVTWRVDTPTEEAHLIAGKYFEWTRPAGAVEAQVFLREDDENLAAKYLEVTAQYVEMYSKLLGPYPYPKFALVENFWETGYGMPSFTLLGPQVIRLPFILHSSYPHEILHNWWGNSVYVDFDRGNWCEGLTAYLADHLVREGLGQGEAYRRDTLAKYKSYVDEGNEISLAEFRSRHSGATEAVGYGKSLMLWHMLRRDIGDQAFVQALGRVYRRHRYQRISFGEIEKVFNETAGRDLARIFDQWISRTGAPELSLQVMPPAEGAEDWSLAVAQVQEEDAYHLQVPVAVRYEGSDSAQTFTVPLHGIDGGPAPRRLSVTLPGGRRPLWVAVDPWVDLFRKLDREEVPPSIGNIFGAARVAVILPSGEGEPNWADFSTAWDPDGGQFELLGEDEITALPSDRPVWILGRENRWAESVREGVRARGTDVGLETLRFGAESRPTSQHCFVLVERHPANPDLTIGWIGADLESALPGLARKLPHYGKYSYLAFEGDEPVNVVKGQWSTDRSPLIWRADGFRGPAPALPEREPLARLAPVFDPAAFRRHIEFLADPSLEGRQTGSAGASRAASYIARAFAEAGLRPGGGDGSFIDEWVEPGPAGPLTLRNVIAVLPGESPAGSGQSVIIGAHLDHLGRGWPDVRAGSEGMIHPGADDNASGVAVLIEVARLLAETHRPSRPIVFVAFDGEEWGRKGSIHYVTTETVRPARDAFAMLSLDAVGRLAGKKLLVLGTGTATEWVHIARGIGFTTGIESTAVADDPGGSDQVSFHEIGIPSVQLTSGPHEDYHRPSDTPDKIDAAGLIQVATWLREALLYLSEREEPLTSTLAGGLASTPAGGGRRVSLGTVPDFAHPGPGVRIDSVLPGSPAEKAGLAGGDLLVKIDGREIADLRAYAEVLRAHAPGDTIAIEVERGGERVQVSATLVER